MQSVSPFVEDNGAMNSAIGLRAYWYADGRYIYGRVQKVTGKTVTLTLEQRWSNRLRITVNWQYVWVADSQETPTRVRQVGPDPMRIASLRQVVAETTQKKKHHITHYNDTDAQSMTSTYIATYENLESYISNIELMKKRVQDLVVDLNEQYRNCSMYGIDMSSLPRLQELQDGQDFKLPGRSAANMEQKRKLSIARERTRELLVALLTAAGDHGVTSEEVIATIGGMGEEKNSLPITQHRIMGMLSSLSRRKEAEMVDMNRWRATALLQM